MYKRNKFYKNDDESKKILKKKNKKAKTDNIEIRRNLQNEISQRTNYKKIITFIIIFSLIFGFILLCIFIFYNNSNYLILFGTLNSNKIIQNNMSKFHDIFPKTNLNKTDNITNLTDIFNSRELFINDEDLTNEYIKFIRPINEEKEKNYTIKLYENVEPKDFINVTRPSKQYAFEEYYQLCKDEKLISDEKFEASNDFNFCYCNYI